MNKIVSDTLVTCHTTLNPLPKNKDLQQENQRGARGAVTRGRLPSWGSRFTRTQHETFIISGCLKSESVLHDMQERLPLSAFSDPWCRVAWGVLHDLGWRNIEKTFHGIKYAIGTLVRSTTGRYMDGKDFATWFDALIDANPAPGTTTKIHARFLIEGPGSEVQDDDV